MRNNDAPEREGEICQADCNHHNLPGPSLRNSLAGRRAFMKKTGMASAATVIALNGLKIEVLATVSAATCGEGVVGCPGNSATRLVCNGGTVHNQNNHNHAVTVNGHSVPATGGLWSPKQNNAECPNGGHGA